MKRTLKIIGIILFAVAAICFIISSFYHWMAMSVLDASASYYARLGRLRHIFLYLGLFFLSGGSVAMIIRMILKKNR